MDETVTTAESKAKADAYYDPILKQRDLPRTELIEKAERWIRESGGRVRVYYRYTCKHCQARCAFMTPNILYDTGECPICGKETIIEEAGFSAVTELVPKGKQKVAHDVKKRKRRSPK